LGEKAPRGLDFDELKVLYEIKGILINETPLHVGSGRDIAPASAVDNPIVRVKTLIDGRPVEVPYIPGSSLKGVLRSTAERLYRSKGEKVCDPFDEGSKKDVGECGEEGEPCLICRIFGGGADPHRVASHVAIFDALPKEPRDPSILQRTRVAIDRDFAAARPRLLFTDEYVQPNVKWEFKMRIINIDLEGDEPEARVLKELLRLMVDPGIQVGGLKSVGAGLVRLLPEETEVKKYKVGKDAGLTLSEEEGYPKKLSELLGWRGDEE